MYCPGITILFIKLYEINKGVIEDDQKYDGGIWHMIKSIVPRGLMPLLLIRLGIKLYLE